jgi:hypothetical protein
LDPDPQRNSGISALAKQVFRRCERLLTLCA